MGRNLKTVIAADKSDRREIGYYSTPGFVAEFFARRILELRPGAHFVFDPCIGRGEFTAPFKARGCHVTGYDVVDMNPQGCDEFVSGDFLGLLMNRNSTPLFFEEPKHNIDVIVANPPYNCHEVDYIRRNKAQLAARFGKAATLNMYALFMRAVLDYAPDGCLIGFVTYDSFLTAAGHHELRRLIIDTCVIHNLHLCPTNLFLDQGADVRTCLLILEKRRRHSVRTKVSNRPASTSEFQDILYGEKPFRECAIQDLLLADSRDKSEFIIDVPSEIADLFHEKRLCEIAPCVTGISTGEDEKYIRREKSERFAVPFYKNPASRQFYAGPDGFLCTDYVEIERTVHNFIVRNKELIFRGGISCSSMGVRFGAAIRPKDSACGVNPNIIVEDHRRWWLLSFLNSRLCLYITRAVIIRGNMITAGYASRIPVPPFDQRTLDRLGELGRSGFDAAREGRPIMEMKVAIDTLIEKFLGFSDATKSVIQAFELDPTRLA